MTPLTPSESRLIADYLAEIDTLLPGTRAERQQIVDELYDGLLEARLAHISNVDYSRDATERAILEFGEPAMVAMYHSRELVIRAAQRTGGRATIALLITALVWSSINFFYGFPNTLGPAGSYSQTTFNGLIELIQITPVVAQLVAVALLILSSRVTHDPAWTRWMQRTSDFLVVLLAIGLGTMIGMLLLAIPFVSEVPLFATAAGVLSMATFCVLIVDALKNSHRIRRVPALLEQNGK